MTRLARWMARRVWWFLLWILRRPPIKRFRARFHLLMPERLREKTRRDIISQDRFARRYGLLVLTVSFSFILASLLVTAILLLVLRLVEDGALTVPDSVRERIG